MTPLFLLLLILGDSLTDSIRIPKLSSAASLPAAEIVPNLSSLSSLSQFLLFHLSRTNPSARSSSCNLNSLTGCSPSDLRTLGFSSAVVDVLARTTATGVAPQIFTETLTAVHLHQVFTLATKLNSVIFVNSAMANILFVNAGAFQQAMDQFFITNPNLKPVLDVRNIPNLSVALISNSIPSIPVLINFACLVSLSVLFDQSLLDVLKIVLPNVSLSVIQGLKSINMALVRVAVLLQSVLFSVVGLSEDDVKHMTGEPVYPSLSQVTLIFPNIQKIQLKGLQLSTELGVFRIPTAELAKASPLYQLINSV